MENKPPQELDSLKLLELVCQLHNRATNRTRAAHEAYVEAREELERRIILNSHITPTFVACNCGGYHSKKNLIDNKCPHCKQKIIVT